MRPLPTRWIVLQAPASLDAVHDAVAAAPGVPHHYGRNLDALHDVLTDAVDLGVIWRGVDDSADALGPDFPRLVATLHAARAANPALVLAWVW